MVQILMDTKRQPIYTACTDFVALFPGALEERCEISYTKAGPRKI